MIQRYDWQGYQSIDGDWCRWSDVEPLLPRWVPTSERLPEMYQAYEVILSSIPGAVFRSIYTERYGWTGKDATKITHWLDFQLPPLPSVAT